ncbi:unnamed protein product [Sympodiomycopsis kandeliae]
MAAADLIILTIGAILAGLYFFRGTLFGLKSPNSADKLSNGSALANAGAGDDAAGDFVAKLQKQNKRIVIFYGSQTGTAEEYATKIAKEIKGRFGASSLVCDPEEYEFEKLDALPEDAAAVFVMATYGEGEPTDNAVTFFEFLKEEPQFSSGDSLSNLKYVVFGLGNRTYEHYNAVARQLDERLTSLGATRIGERGEGDDDKSMEEDYLAWKDGMLDALASQLGLEEGAGGDVQDFEVKELTDHEATKVYQGELSARALLGTKGIHDAKNPYLAPISKAKELFSAGERTCVHTEFDIEGSGISYQHGDHLALWAHNPEREVIRMLAILGLLDKRHSVIDVTSLDPALAKVPFPTPTTYEAIFRHYLDVAGHVGRQALSTLSKFAPNGHARQELEKIGSDKTYFQEKVGRNYYTLGEALQSVAGDNLDGEPSSVTRWDVPFDRIISAIHRLGPRFYSISSSPKLHPKTIHITAVVLRYAPDHQPDRYVHGLATNFISTIKMSMNNETPSGPNDPRFTTPKYALEGPRGSYINDGRFRAPVHVRRANFRLPTSPKIPVIMVGPGTGVAPFRSFVQERVATAKKALDKNGANALSEWGNMWLFYGCRKSNEDFLYQEEWPEYAQTLGDKFKMETAISREKFKPDGSKLYVQDLIWQKKAELAREIIENKASIYICGDAAGMAHDVEDTLLRILTEAKGSKESAQREVKLLKERSKWLLDVWS